MRNRILNSAMSSRDRIEQFSEIFKSEMQIAMYLRPSARQYELAVRGIDVLESDANSAKNYVMLNQRFEEENGDPSHLMGIPDYHLDTEMAFIQLEMDFIETITRSAVRYGWAVWSADMNKAIMRHTFWRVYRIDDSKLQDQMLRIVRRIVRCWNRLEKLRIEAISKPVTVQSPDSTGTTIKEEIPQKPKEPVEISQLSQSRIIAIHVPPARYLTLCLIGVSYLIWQLFSEKQ